VPDDRHLRQTFLSLPAPAEVAPLCLIRLIDSNNLYQRRIADLNVQRPSIGCPTKNQATWAPEIIRVVFDDFRVGGQERFLDLAWRNIPFLRSLERVAVEGVFTSLYRRLNRSSNSQMSRIHQRRHARQLLPLQELQRRATARAHVREAVRQPQLLDDRCRLATADDRRGLPQVRDHARQPV